MRARRRQPAPGYCRSPSPCRDALERQSQELTKKDKEFEKVLKEGLTKDQEKRYDKWKAARDKAERERLQHMRRPASGGNP